MQARGRAKTHQVWRDSLEERWKSDGEPRPVAGLALYL
jgi:hypothetical protein